MDAILSWFRRHWRFGLALIVFAIGSIVVLVLYIRKKRAEAITLKSQLEMLKAASKVWGLEDEKESKQAELELEQNKAKAQKLDEEIAAARRKLVSVVKDTSNMQDDEVLKEFKRHGY